MGALSHNHGSDENGSLQDWFALNYKQFCISMILGEKVGDYATHAVNYTYIYIYLY